MKSEISFRERVATVVCDALRSLPNVLAGWEGGSAAFGALDEYSDLDLNVLVSDGAAIPDLYAATERALESVSPITLVHDEPPGRYYKFRDGGSYFFLDLCFLPEAEVGQWLSAERHGAVRKLFDNGSWLEISGSDARPWEERRIARLNEMKDWFPASQSFVWKTVHRGQPAEALAAYWGYTLRPLVELLRMKYCPERWDFGMRYLGRDLPRDVYDRLRDAMYVPDFNALSQRLTESDRWGRDLIAELLS